MTATAPRPRRSSAGVVVTFALGGSFTAVGLLVGLLFTAIGGPVWDDWILDARGVTVTATATDVPSHEQTKRPGSKGVRWYRVGVDVPGPGGPTHARLWANEGDVTQMRGDPQVAVDVDPQAPTRARLAGGSASFFGLFVLIPAAFVVGGLPLLALCALLALRRTAFLRNAEVSRGEVVEVTRMGGKGSTQRVHLAWPGPAGAPAQGTCLHNPPVSPGDAVWVAWDRRAPSRCEILGPAG